MGCHPRHGFVQRRHPQERQNQRDRTRFLGEIRGCSPNRLCPPDLEGSPGVDQDVVVDRDWQRVRSLEDHADLLANLYDLDLGRVDVLVVYFDAALDPRVAEALDDAIDAA